MKYLGIFNILYVTHLNVLNEMQKVESECKVEATI